MLKRWIRFYDGCALYIFVYPIYFHVLGEDFLRSTMMKISIIRNCLTRICILHYPYWWDRCMSVMCLPIFSFCFCQCFTSLYLFCAGTLSIWQLFSWKGHLGSLYINMYCIIFLVQLSLCDVLNCALVKCLVDLRIRNEFNKSLEKVHIIVIIITSKYTV